MMLTRNHDFLLEAFSSDSRYMEACHFLSSNKEMKLSVKKVQNWDTLTDDQQKDLKLKLLDKVFLRQISKMVGRGVL